MSVVLEGEAGKKATVSQYETGPRRRRCDGQGG